MWAGAPTPPYKPGQALSEGTGPGKVSGAVPVRHGPETKPRRRTPRDPCDPHDRVPSPVGHLRTPGDAGRRHIWTWAAVHTPAQAIS
ncbi:hypothetical protein Airi01_027170 [Actinoallomurus iriomotensis]|uniref:Uncharacterized protein n=1 Tax=Actinoallomurus iriomotensis TaxID=478107 RepID=A0A9W6VN83_9ACTN|nr:hypothetical protein Airi01_027170 [Actinoallomurus iriomotensis]